MRDYQVLNVCEKIVALSRFQITCSVGLNFKNPFVWIRNPIQLLGKFVTLFFWSEAIQWIAIKSLKM